MSVPQWCIDSFLASCAAGESTTQAADTVSHEINETWRELIDAGLPTGDIAATLEAWQGLYVRDLYAFRRGAA